MNHNIFLLINQAYQEYRDKPIEFPDGFNESFSLKHAWQKGFMLGLKLADLPHSPLHESSYEDYRRDCAGYECIYTCRLEEYFKEGCLKALSYAPGESRNNLDVEPRKISK